MIRFLGEFEVSLDPKNRFLLPSVFRKQLAAAGQGSNFVLNRGIEKCISIYPETVWEEMQAKFDNLDEFEEEERMFKRLFLNGASPAELDNADRLLITKKLQVYAGIDKIAVITAMGNKLELWDADTYYSYIDSNTPKFSALGGKVRKSLKNNAEPPKSDENK